MHTLLFINFRQMSADKTNYSATRTVLANSQRTTHVLFRNAKQIRNTETSSLVKLTT